MSSETVEIPISDVKNGVKYYVRLRGKNRKGQGRWSSPAIEVTPKGKPPKPTITATGVNGNGVITVTLENDGGFPITNYKYALNEVTEYQLVYPESSTPLNGNTFTLSNLVPGEYKIRVIAVNSAGESPPSDEKTFSAGSIPQIPEITVESTANFSNSFAIVTVTSDTTNISSFKYECGTSSNISYTTGRLGNLYGSVVNNPFNITNLNALNTYYLRVASVNSVGTSEWSSTATFYVGWNPGTASNLSLSRGTRSFSGSFTHGVENGYPIIGYRCLYNTENSFLLTSTSPPTVKDVYYTSDISNNSFTITGLSDNTTYYVRLASINARGVGSSTDTRNIRTYAVPISPDQDSIFLRHSGNLLIDVTIYRPIVSTSTQNWHNTPKITAFKYSLNDGPFITIDIDNVTINSRNQYSFSFSSGLSYGDSCSINVFAVNEVGDGPSRKSNTIILYGPPSGLTITSATITRISGRWGLNISYNLSNTGGYNFNELTIKFVYRIYSGSHLRKTVKTEDFVTPVNLTGLSGMYRDILSDTDVSTTNPYRYVIRATVTNPTNVTTTSPDFTYTGPLA